MESKVSELRKFGFILGFAFLLITVYTAYRHRLVPELGAVAVILLALTLVHPKALAPVKWFWDNVGLVLGTVNTYILLFLIYFLIITPIGLIMRLLGKDALKLKPQKPQSSYWEQAPVETNSSMERQF
ncbi:hypothetical protein GCM10011425_21190 [Mucilaginibacter galii]|uniref:SxtJ n=1 Tax=Mucilaginibacter galii TaxID=2005073 RepID=A0A917JA25_9SPHI|nr:SxtJ family membrane protein [Mucilaginibacter galii]GGI50907.1 hypothetical protein GCM10011425_21190 [Mucilaginibacter galii]